MPPRLVFSLACFLVTSTTSSLSFGSSFTSSLSSAPRPFETASEPARRALLSRAGGLLLPLVLQDGARPALAATPSGSKSSKATKGGGGGVATAKTVEELEALPPPPLPAWAVFLSSDARLASAFVYAVTTPVGVPLFAIDLDDKERVRSVGFFFETKAEAEAELRNAKASGAAVASKAVVAAVPLATALALAYQPVSKRTGFPGYFCHRFRLSPEVKADALHLSGLAGLSDVAVPVFYEDPNGPLFLRLSDLVAARGAPSKQQQKQQQQQEEEEEQEQRQLKRGVGVESNGGGGGADTPLAVGVADLGRVAKEWAAAAATAAAQKDEQQQQPGALSSIVVGAGGAAAAGKKPSPNRITYDQDGGILAIEWNI